jgi:hypothetical protein
LQRLSLSLKQLLKLALEGFEFVKSAPELSCAVGGAVRRCIVVIASITVVAAATRAARSIIAVVIFIVASIATPIILFMAMPLDHAEPPVRHIRSLVLVVPPTECVPCEIKEHFLELSVADSRTDDLSHYVFRRLNVVVSYRVATASPTRRRVAHAGDGHFIGID